MLHKLDPVRKKGKQCKLETFTFKNREHNRCIYVRNVYDSCRKTGDLRGIRKSSGIFGNCGDLSSFKLKTKCSHYRRKYMTVVRLNVSFFLTSASFPSKRSKSLIARLDSFLLTPARLVIIDMYFHTSFKI